MPSHMYSHTDAVSLEGRFPYHCCHVILTCVGGSSYRAACCTHVYSRAHSIWFAVGRNSTDLLSSATVVGTHDPVTLQERIETFLDSSTTLLADLQAEDFERHRQALIAAKLQQCHSLLDESDRHWEQVQTRRCVLTGH